MSESSLSRAEIFQAVADILADRLAVAREEIAIDSGLIDDLGIDSLDFLDAIFCLERRFGIKVRDSAFNRLLRGETPAGAQADGALSGEDLETLAVYLPKLRAQSLELPVTMRQLWSCVTVESLVIVVEQRLSGPSSEA